MDDFGNGGDRHFGMNHCRYRLEAGVSEGSDLQDDVVVVLVDVLDYAGQHGVVILCAMPVVIGVVQQFLLQFNVTVDPFQGGAEGPTSLLVPALFANIVWSSFFVLLLLPVLRQRLDGGALCDCAASVQILLQFPIHLTAFPHNP